MGPSNRRVLGSPTAEADAMSFPDSFKAPSGGVILEWNSGEVHFNPGRSVSPTFLIGMARWLDAAAARIDGRQESQRLPRCSECKMTFFHLKECPIRIKTGDFNV